MDKRKKNKVLRMVCIYNIISFIIALLTYIINRDIYIAIFVGFALSLSSIRPLYIYYSDVKEENGKKKNKAKTDECTGAQ